MSRKPRVQRSPEEKWQIVLEALKSGNVAETCRKYEIAPNLYYRWKDEVEAGAKAALGGEAQPRGPVLFLLWWIPPVTNGKPFALYEQILNPTHTGILEMLRQIAKQTHLHLVLIGPGQALLGVYEFESTFGLEKLISISESASKEYGGMDLIAAKGEYDRTYKLMEVFGMSEPRKEEETESESEQDSENEDEFLIAQSSEQESCNYQGKCNDDRLNNNRRYSFTYHLTTCTGWPPASALAP